MRYFRVLVVCLSLSIGIGVVSDAVAVREKRASGAQTFEGEVKAQKGGRRKR